MELSPSPHGESDIWGGPTFPLHELAGKRHAIAEEKGATLVVYATPNAAVVADASAPEVDIDGLPVLAKLQDNGRAASKEAPASLQVLNLN